MPCAKVRSLHWLKPLAFFSQHSRSAKPILSTTTRSMAVCNRAVVALFLCSWIMSAKRLHRGVELNHGMEELEGIDDYPLATEFDKPLTNKTELDIQLKNLWSYLHRKNRKEFILDARSYVQLIRSYYVLDSQDSQDPESNVYAENCQEICMWCEPTKDELEAGEGFRSVLITRTSQWREKLDLLKPSSKKQCGRVGFEFYIHGKHNSSPFSTATLSSSYGLKELRDRTGENKDEVAALSHCEWLRRNNVDVRHAEECLKHNMLCKGQALPIPNNHGESPAEFCRKVSKKWGPPKVNSVSPDWYPAELFRKALQEQELEQERARQWAEEKAKALKEQKKKCIELLCKWGGYKKASLKLHPDRLIRMNLPEKDWLNRTETFEYLVGCKDDLQLTLTDKAERETTCASQN